MQNSSPTIPKVRAALAKGATEEAALLLRESGSEQDSVLGNLMIARYFKSKRLLPRAIDYYKFAQQYEVEAQLPDTYVELARAFISLKCFSDALSHSEEGARLFPESAELHALVALSSAALRNRQVCEEAIVRALSLELNGSAADTLAEALRRHSELKSSTDDRDYIAEAYRQFPELPDIARLYGERALKRGQSDLAVEALTAAAQAYPNGPRQAAVALKLREARQRAGVASSDLADEGDAARLAAPAIHQQFNVAAITNVYNEKHNLPIWLDHYGRQVGRDRCVILDHGSDDGSTSDLGGAGVIRLARGKIYDERHRMRLITDLANSLLGYYNAVVYSDCDEMFVADPDKYENVVDYARQMKGPVAFAIGLNVRHNPDTEADLTAGEPVLSQRSLVQFVSPMCKPLLINKPVSWGGGFHCCEYPPSFNDAYLFHLRHADMRRALDRLRITREIKFAREGGGKHHRRDEGELIEKAFRAVTKMNVRENFDFYEETEKHRENIELSFSGRYAIAKSVNVRHLNVIPDRFKSLF